MSAPVSPLQPNQEPVRRCKHDVSEDCPACAEETIAGLKACCVELEAKTALVTFNEACKRIEELEAALRNTEGSLSKVANWLGRLAGAAEQRAKDTRFLSLADANAADAKNYRATIASIMPVLQAARAALPSSTPARAKSE